MWFRMEILCTSDSMSNEDILKYYRTLSEMRAFFFILAKN